METQIDSTNGNNNSQDEISLLDLFGVLLHYKFLIIGMTAFGAIFSVIIAIVSLKLPPEKSFLPNQYSPSAVMLITESSSGSSMPSGLSSLASIAGVNIGGERSSNSSLAKYLASSNLLFDADKRATEITKSLSQSAEQNQAPKQQKKQTQDYDMCF